MAELNKRRNNEKTKRIALTGILSAIIIVFSFTFIGYLNIGVISITFITIPVVIGAMMGGASTGTILGLVFGVTSLIHCFGLDVFGTTLMSISPVKTVILCLVPRILMGLLTALIFKLFKRFNVRDIISIPLTAFFGGMLNTVFFVLFLAVMFGQSDYLRTYGDNIITIIGTLITFNAVIEWFACIFVGAPITKYLIKFINKS